MCSPVTCQGLRVGLRLTKPTTFNLSQVSRLHMQRLPAVAAA
jgi:hypothetical protein